MGKDANQVQTQCGTCQLTADREESYAPKTREAHLCSTWQKASCHESTIKDTSLEGWQRVTFCMIQSFSKKRYDGDPLRCLGPEEVREMIKEMHSGECGGVPGKEKAPQMPTANELLLPYHKERYARICEKVP